MKTKAKQILVPFILMIVINLTTYSLSHLNFGEGINPHIGILFIAGLLFGPYGALGAASGNFLCDIIRGYGLSTCICSGIVSFGVSLLAYKLWYENFKSRPLVTKPKLNNTTNLILFITIILFCALIYSILHQKIVLFFYPSIYEISYNLGFRYWLNFTNSSFLMGIIGIWISQRIDFVEVPQKSEKPFNKKLYQFIGLALMVTLIAVAITDYVFNVVRFPIIGESIVTVALLYAYLTKPNVSEVKEINYHSISESIMNMFMLITIILLIFGYIISGDNELINSALKIFPLEIYELVSNILLFVDIILAFYLIPALGVLKYIEKKVVDPIVKFSQIEGIIKEGNKIEAESLIETYAEYDHEENEIGYLARSYTELIQYNNNYIENIKEIEGEREKIKTELDIAERIQRSNLPTESMENENYAAYGYTKPATEVGGDFFDYYRLDDESIALVIGDASGKGIPAALLSVIAQNLIKQKAKSTKDPSKILESLNNQIYENNQEFMFITLWLGIYNEKTNKIAYSNAGHAPPLIKENGAFKRMDIDRGIAIGVLENYEYKTEERTLEEALFLYTDGITDASNSNDEFYGEGKLIEFLNSADFTSNVINGLLKDINEFTNGEEQYDDMTILTLVKK